MSSTVSPFSQGAISLGLARSVPDEAPDRGDNSKAGGDLAWQRALEQARQMDFGGWFGKSQPLSATAFSMMNRGAVMASDLAHRSPSVQVDRDSHSADSIERGRQPSSEETSPNTQVPAAVGVGPGTGTRGANSGLSTGQAPMASRVERIGQVQTARGPEVAMPGNLEELVAVVARGLSINVVAASSVEDASLKNSPGPSLQAEIPLRLTDGNPSRATSVVGRAAELDPPEEHSQAEELPTGADAPRGSTGPARRESAEQEPLRIYAEWSDRGVSIWLGSDAHVLSQLQPLALQLQQWIETRGERLIGLVCNGRALPLPPSVGFKDAMDDERDATPVSSFAAPSRQSHFTLSIDPYSPESL